MKWGILSIFLISLGMTVPFLEMAEIEDVELLALGMGNSPFLDFFRTDMDNFYYVAPDQQFLHPYLLKLMTLFDLEGKFWMRLPSAFFFALGNVFAFLFLEAVSPRYFHRTRFFSTFQYSSSLLGQLRSLLYNDSRFLLFTGYLMERRDEFPMKYFESLFLFVSSLAYFTNIMSILFTVPLLAFLIYEKRSSLI